MLSLSWHWIFLALTHGNWLSFKQSPRTSVTVASSCEKLWLIFLPSLSGPRKSWTVLRLPDLDSRRVHQSFSYKSTACGKGGLLSHKSILNSWSSTFFGMQILSPDVGRYWCYPKSLFRTSLTSYPDFWYNRELYSFLKDYSVFSWGRASSSWISAMLAKQKWPIILLTVETSTWKLWEISLNWPAVEPAVIGMTVEFWNLVQDLAQISLPLVQGFEAVIPDPAMGIGAKWA